MTRNSKSSSSAISRLTHLEEENKDLQMKLSLADKEIVSLKIQLEDSKGHSKQYKIISETMEKTIKEASESNEKTKKVLETSLSNLDEELNKLKESYDELLSHKTELEANFAREKEFYETKIDLLEKEKNQVSSDFDILSKSYENMEKILEERTIKSFAFTDG